MNTEDELVPATGPLGISSIVSDAMNSQRLRKLCVWATHGPQPPLSFYANAQGLLQLLFNGLLAFPC